MQIKKEEFSLVGIRLAGKTNNANDQSSKDCGNLWQRFEKEEIFNQIESKKSDEVIAVYCDYEGDEKGDFSYFIGCKVDANAPVPEGLDRLNIPAQTYEKAVAKGKMTGCITDAWNRIWDSELRRKFGYDFEVYDARSRDWNDAEVDIYVSTSE